MGFPEDWYVDEEFKKSLEICDILDDAEIKTLWKLVDKEYIHKYLNCKISMRDDGKWYIIKNGKLFSNIGFKYVIEAKKYFDAENCYDREY